MRLSIAESFLVRSGRLCLFHFSNSMVFLFGILFYFVLLIFCAHILVSEFVFICITFFLYMLILLLFDFKKNDRKIMELGM